MDFTRLAVDTGQFINRAVQYTGESLGQVEKTPLDPGLEELLARADATKMWTDQIISQTEVLLQPNPGARLEDRLYEHLDWRIQPRPRAHEALGEQMTQAGMEMGSNTPYGMALVRFGEGQKHFGEAEKKFVQSTNIHFLTPLKSFSEGEYRAIQDERKMLVNKRLDLDIARTRLRKAHEADREARNLNANPLEDDYIAHVSYMFSFLRVKWLKMWAQEISQAEMELRICQSLFDRQSEITKRVVEGIGNTHINHMRSLTDFVEAQACFFDQCNQHAQELQKQLASIPAVLCSNNWQAEISNTVSQPSASNHVANEPIGLNQVTPIPIIIHQVPDFDQDSWNANSTPQSENSTMDSSVTALPPGQTNNNNNNNTILTETSQDTSQGSPPDQAFHRVPISHLDSQTTNQTMEPTITTVATTNVTESLTTTTITSILASPSSEPNGTSNESQTADAVAGEIMMNGDTTIETSTNGTTSDPQPINETDSEVPTINGEDVQ